MQLSNMQYPVDIIPIQPRRLQQLLPYLVGQPLRLHSVEDHQIQRKRYSDYNWGLRLL